MSLGKIADFKNVGDSKSLKEIDGKPFTIIKVERSDYDDTPGVKFTTEESFDIDGKSWNKFHTSRQAIVGKFLNEYDDYNPTEATKAVNNGTKFHVKCELVKGEKGKKDYYVLRDVESETKQEALA